MVETLAARWHLTQATGAATSERAQLSTLAALCYESARATKRAAADQELGMALETDDAMRAARLRSLRRFLSSSDGQVGQALIEREPPAAP